jgi:ribosomal protein L30E
MEAEIRQLVRDEKIVIGRDVVLKKLKAGKISKVFLASNCPAVLVSELEHYQKLQEFGIEKTDVTNEELGILCRKRFFVSIIGVIA